MIKTLEVFLEEALVIMVIYRCSPQESATWISIVAEAASQKVSIDLLVYDNSPEPQLFPTAPFITMHYRHNALNPGVSMAYNEGCILAREKQKKWLLLLDQDTRFGAGWFEAYYQTTVEKPEALVAVPILISGSVVISPFRYWLTKGVSSAGVDPGEYSLRQYYAVNSGLLIDRKVFESVGGYDESIPMDFSDFAFMSKLKKNNYRMRVIGLQGDHRLSSLAPMEEEGAQQRFRQYCVGSKRLAPYTGQSFLHFVLAGGRAVRLGIQYRSLTFVSILIQSWATG
jgi:GT2 family glycosyltransferase